MHPFFSSSPPDRPRPLSKKKKRLSPSASSPSTSRPPPPLPSKGSGRSTEPSGSPTASPRPRASRRPCEAMAKRRGRQGPRRQQHQKNKKTRRRSPTNQKIPPSPPGSRPSRMPATSAPTTRACVTSPRMNAGPLCAPERACLRLWRRRRRRPGSRSLPRRGRVTLPDSSPRALCSPTKFEILRRATWGG